MATGRTACQNRSRSMEPGGDGALSGLVPGGAAPAAPCSGISSRSPAAGRPPGRAPAGVVAGGARSGVGDGDWYALRPGRQARGAVYRGPACSTMHAGISTGPTRPRGVRRHRARPRRWRARSPTRRDRGDPSIRRRAAGRTVGRPVPACLHGTLLAFCWSTRCTPPLSSAEGFDPAGPRHPGSRPPSACPELYLKFEGRTHRVVQGPRHGACRREGARGGAAGDLRARRAALGLGGRVRGARGPRGDRGAPDGPDRSGEAAAGAGRRVRAWSRRRQLRRRAGSSANSLARVPGRPSGHAA